MTMDKFKIGTRWKLLHATQLLPGWAEFTVISYAEPLDTFTIRRPKHLSQEVSRNYLTFLKLEKVVFEIGSVWCAQHDPPDTFVRYEIVHVDDFCDLTFIVHCETPYLQKAFTINFAELIKISE